MLNDTQKAKAGQVSLSLTLQTQQRIRSPLGEEFSGLGDGDPATQAQKSWSCAQ